jgi:outer membrane lipoprotein LolB
VNWCRSIWCPFNWCQTPNISTSFAQSLCVVILLTGGCALQPRVPGTSVAWGERQAQLAEISEWQARGRIAVKSAEGGGQGNIQWFQAGAGSRISLRGPFGTGAYEISWDTERIEVVGKSGEIEMAYSGPDAVERFLLDQLGWSFPAMSLRYWILGVPDPGFESRELFDTEGWLVGIQQNGWSVGYDGFKAWGEIWLPKRVVLNHDEARVKLVIDDWAL